jgi:hypothetical protein
VSTLIVTTLHAVCVTPAGSHDQVTVTFVVNQALQF